MMVEYSELNEYKLVGELANLTVEYLEYKKTAMVHGNLEYGIIYDTVDEEEYTVQVDHVTKTISLAPKNRAL